MANIFQNLIRSGIDTRKKKCVSFATAAKMFRKLNNGKIK